MFGLSTAKLIGGGLAVLFIGGMVFGFWRYMDNLQETNRILSEQVGTLDTAVKTQADTIDAQETALQEYVAAQERFREELQELATDAREARQERERLLEVFGDSDFTAIVNARPDTAERLINRGSDRALRMLECATGAGGADCPSDGGAEAGEAGPSEAGAD